MRVVEAVLIASVQSIQRPQFALLKSWFYKSAGSESESQMSISSLNGSGLLHRIEIDSFLCQSCVEENYAADKTLAQNLRRRGRVPPEGKTAVEGRQVWTQSFLSPFPGTNQQVENPSESTSSAIWEAHATDGTTVWTKEWARAGPWVQGDNEVIALRCASRWSPRCQLLQQIRPGWIVLSFLFTW